MTKDIQVAVITGAASGIGRACAIRLASNGLYVGLLDLNESEAVKVQSTIEQHGGKALFIQCNIAKGEDVQQAFNKVMSEWGKVDVVCANAGIAGTLSPIESMSEEEWDTTMSVNVKGTFLTVKHAIPHLKMQGGSIIITSSVSGNRMFSQAGFAAYSTSKASQVAFMKMAALELAKYKIRVNAICPGAIETNIGESIEASPSVKNIEIPISFPEGDQPLEHGPGQPEQVADLVEFLASPESAHITGTEIYIDGGESLLRG
ncbi:SDR family NAD(P)-dependent oxidoreductase [Alkalihalobacillus sp. LMS39]|uniref:SDR family oxidoreductase n=1 Tax=Alkalihalobacillus sp. LMS39 TaxID=2924032 RepID=UPI001FB30667|nr:SDR family NAD(P)-dependent oxidoreductase [Alkalihalobacillus sp. LMS39]UOE94939.1 SDR family oxidoreductase [Alkalihalobacillus sp. LMS39]